LRGWVGCNNCSLMSSNKKPGSTPFASLRGRCSGTRPTKRTGLHFQPGLRKEHFVPPPASLLGDGRGIEGVGCFLISRLCEERSDAAISVYKKIEILSRVQPHSLRSGAGAAEPGLQRKRKSCQARPGMMVLKPLTASQTSTRYCSRRLRPKRCHLRRW